MALRRIQVTDFRCLFSAELELDPRLTLISGANASGKTSLLEAIYVLSRGRSFRTRRLDRLIRSGTERFVVFGDVALGDRRVALGVEGTVAGIRARLAGAAVPSLAELAAVLPAQIIDPEIHRLIEEGPSRRRRFLDWGVFHVEHSFVGTWRAYQQVLRQRNAALRARQPKSVVSAWDGELLRLGGQVDQARTRYLGLLEGVASDITRRLLGLELGLAYRPGWNLDSSFATALSASWGRDWDAGMTCVGPQRAELSVRLAGVPVKERVSRGQQKLLGAALLLAQVSLFPGDSDVRPTLLLDDPAAELDSGCLWRLIREVNEHAVQLVVTSLDTEFSAFGTPGRRYLLDGGIVRAG